MFNKDEEVLNVKRRIEEYSLLMDNLEGLERVGYVLAIKKLKEELKNLESNETAIEYQRRKGTFYDVNPF